MGTQPTDDTRLGAARTLARRHLIDFALLTNRRYRPGWHHHATAAHLERVARGECDRLMVLMPPRHGKSELASRCFPAWYLGNYPERRVIATSYSLDLALDFGRWARNMVSGLMYRAVFPGVEIAGDSSSAGRWDLTTGGGYVAAGVGGPITGRGGNLLIIDDPVKNHEEANSAPMRDKMWDWYRSTLYTRLEEPGAIVLIMTNWHEDDLAGRLLTEAREGGDEWTVLRLPAVAEGNEWISGKLRRREGEPLWPEKYDADTLARIRRAVGSDAWSALYQQRAQAAGGGVFKREWWRSYGEAPATGGAIVQSWDTAMKTGQQNDFSVCTTWMEGEGGYFLLDMWRERVEAPELERMALALWDKWRPHVVLIEDAASGVGLIQNLRRKTRLPVKPVRPEGDKVARANALAPTVEAGRVLIPARAPWLADFLDEMSAFPRGTHDDVVDSTTQALLYLTGRGRREVRVRWL